MRWIWGCKLLICESIRGGSGGYYTGAITEWQGGEWGSRTAVACFPASLAVPCMMHLDRFVEGLRLLPSQANLQSQCIYPVLVPYLSQLRYSQFTVSLALQCMHAVSPGILQSVYLKPLL